MITETPEEQNLPGFVCKVEFKNVAGGLKLIMLRDRSESPLIDHHPLEIGFCEETRTFYAYEVFVRTYGTKGVLNSCRKFLETAVHHGT